MTTEYMTETRRAQRIRSMMGNINREILDLRALGHTVNIGVKHDATFSSWGSSSSNDLPCVDVRLRDDAAAGGEAPTPGQPDSDVPGATD